MNQPIDLNAHLLAIYLQTEQITHPDNDREQFSLYISSLEHWFKRLQHHNYPLVPSSSHLFLGLINVSLYMVQSGIPSEDEFTMEKRLLTLKSEVINKIGCSLPESYLYTFKHNYSPFEF